MIRPFTALVLLTCRSAVRSHFFRSLLLLFLAVVFLIPVMVQSDGTAAGMIRITLEYSFGMIGVILSLSAIWLGASEITTDVEDARLHMIAVKPVSRPTIFFAKLTGVLLIHAILLVFASAVVYGLTMYRIAATEYKDGEREQLDKEVLVGRRLYRPDTAEEDVDAAAEAMIRKRLDEAKMRGEDLPPEWLTVQNKKGEFDRAEILKRMRDTYRMNRDKIRPGNMHEWTYSGLPEDLDGPIRVRYKIFSTEGQLQQDQSSGLWGWRYNVPLANDDQGRADSDILFFPKTGDINLITFRTAEFEISPRDPPGPSRDSYRNSLYHCARGPLSQNKDVRSYQIIPVSYPADTYRMVKDGKGTLLFQNLDPSKTLFVQPEDGPVLLIPQVGFFSNYCRAVCSVFFQIMLLCMLGTAFSACFTLPTGIFLTFSYVLLCQATRFVLDIYTTTVVKPHGTFEWISFYASKGIDFLLVDLNGFSAPSMLSAGELVEFSWLAKLLFADVLLRTLPFLLIGLWIYSKRELGTAAKE